MVDNILTVVQSDTSPTFQTSVSIRVKECKVKDEHLTWEEFSQVNYQMLNAMWQQDWPNEHIVMIRDFWLALEGHEWRHDPSEYRKQALLIYQGHWAGEAFTIYLRHHALVLTPFLQANQQLLENFNQIAMPPVC
ncbi:hypothetical protein PAXRUDRAFT_160328 [Paxillus rubicundulus Ve08.2h10]|uniref:Unplaced genomic scaffold scaffold_1363, whole genome shotgun sequence n=1 Tax=Paxillus rubicundulus Ve08.2h10 TaxID=930991 RepID=A0A0D0CW89_9AGAM|nr:hypothetical protein PAXRUDRAFT_160328 [Paxillus rubicundulus Ve08.2h10]